MDYQSTLEISNALDFEDIMVKSLGVILARPSTVAHIQHILVDEFQDTSLLQYELIHRLANASGASVSVVGDGDQAIYGWRFADPVNFQRMKTDFKKTHVVNLQENYRSTALLAVSQAIISQDNERPAKSLYTSQTPSGPLPYLQQEPSLQEEAQFISTEIPRLIATSNGMLSYGDFAILLRYNHATKDFEKCLDRYGIPYRVLPRPKHELYHHSAVKDILAYLRLAATPAFTPWLLRILRMMDGIEPEAVTDILAGSLMRKVIALKVIQDGCKGIESTANAQTKEKLSQLVAVLNRLRKEMMQGTSPAELIESIIQQCKHHWTNDQRRKFSQGQGWVKELLKEARHFETRK